MSLAADLKQEISRHEDRLLCIMYTEVPLLRSMNLTRNNRIRNKSVLYFDVNNKKDIVLMLNLDSEEWRIIVEEKYLSEGAWFYRYPAIAQGSIEDMKDLSEQEIQAWLSR